NASIRQASSTTLKLGAFTSSPRRRPRSLTCHHAQAPRYPNTLYICISSLQNTRVNRKITIITSLTLHPAPGLRSSTVHAHRYPPRHQVILPPGLVVQVVGVLPDIHAEDDPRLTLHHRVVLVWRLRHRQATVHVDDQPCPAGSELAQTSRLDRFLHRRHIAELRRDRFGEGACRLAAPAR